jgi:MoaA/NifB/PqqE/SkfB family radical SAM enzyme
MDISAKLNVLEKVASLFSQSGISYALSSSCLLYFHGLVSDFHDLDFMIKEKDADKVIELLKPLGAFQERIPNEQYQTKRFLEFTIEGVEIDIMGGFVIVKDGKAYPCPFTPKSIGGVSYLHGVPVYLGRLEDWLTYYTLMGREAKAKIISDYFEKLKEEKDSA